jgi:signal transduction histidine kinase
MNNEIHCIILTRDTDLRQRLTGFLKLRVQLEFKDPSALTKMPSEIGQSALLLLDLRVWKTSAFLQDGISETQKNFILLLGNRRSEPALEAAKAGFPHIADLEVGRLELQGQIEQMQEHLMIQTELSLLRVSMEAQAVSKKTETPHLPNFQSIAKRLTQTLQQLYDADSLFKELVKIVSQAMSVPRITLMLVDHDSKKFVSRAMLRAKTDSSPVELPCNSYLAQNLNRQASVLSRQSLIKIEDAVERMELLRIFNSHGIDYIVPLYGRKDLLGWLMLGCKASGEALAEEALNELIVLCDEVSPIIEATLQSEISKLRQRVLENVFQSLPTGLIAFSAAERLLWMNQAAENLLEQKFPDVLDVPYADLDKSLAEKIPDLIEASVSSVPFAATLQNGRRVEVKVVHYNTFSGIPASLLLLEDATLKEAFRDEREKVRRNELLSEISTNISVGIRAPLTAIKTFTQLLPEHFHDQAFCDQFQSIVGEEVSRLDHFTESISTVTKLGILAQQKKVVFSFSKCVETAKCLSGQLWEQVVSQPIGSDYPLLEGYPDRIGEALCHLITNSSEAVADIGNDRITLSVNKGVLGKNVKTLEVTVADNRSVKKIGSFVDNSNLASEDVIRRADLRLSIVSKIVHENAGTMSVQSTENGVLVKMIFPAYGRMS